MSRQINLCAKSFVSIKTEVLFTKTPFFFFLLKARITVHNPHFNIKTSKYVYVKTSQWFSSLKCLSLALSIGNFKTTTKCWHSYSRKNGMKFSLKFHACYLSLFLMQRICMNFTQVPLACVRHHKFVYLISITS